MRLRNGKLRFEMENMRLRNGNMRLRNGKLYAFEKWKICCTRLETLENVRSKIIKSIVCVFDYTLATMK